jgi:hypothetical protein
LDEKAPGSISPSGRVPSSLPSLTQSSQPFASQARNTTLPPT